MKEMKLSNRFVSLILCISLLLSCFPLSMFAFSEPLAATPDKVADDSTLDGWKAFFPITGDLTTENAGGVWTDKSVFTDASLFSGISMKNEDNFLVALSAIGSNMTIEGQASVPIDTMLVLDVSGSMSGDASDLVSATNAAITELMTEANNRVGVVLYSGTRTSNNNNDAAVTLLPLGHYKTGTDNRYIRYANGAITLDDSVKIEATGASPSTTSKGVSGATYTQKGIIKAAEILTSDSNVLDPSENRKPVIVLMSDGDPTLGTNNFTSPGQFNIGWGSQTSAGLGFVTQLSIAYAKSLVETKYGTDALLYTLGLGTSGNAVSTNILNPNNNRTDQTTRTMKGYWTSYEAAAVGGAIEITHSQENHNYRGNVIKVDTPIERYYVDGYYSANQGSDLADVFQTIVNEIALQSKYFPTLVAGDEEVSGYVSFVDSIGEYMEVTDIKGIYISGTLFSGADLAKNFAAGGNGGDLGTTEEPTALGEELIGAVQARLGIESEDIARTLVGNAYTYGQLSYKSATEFSNYIGWCADSAGKYLGFWHEGMDVSAIPEGTAYIMKSYGYLGATDSEHGVSESDMMYATVQLREEYNADGSRGDQMMTFAVPAALLPLVTYEVTLDENDNLTNLVATGATSPIRLVYEVGMRSNINEFNLTEKVSAEYIAANTVDGKVNFYTNKFESDLSTGYGKVNAYSYFRPSRQNDRYYHQNDSLVYADESGTIYNGDAPTGTKYYAFDIYVKTGASTYKTQTVYHSLPEDTLAKAIDNGNGTYTIPAGYVRRDYNHYQAAKSENITGTLPFAEETFTDIDGHTVDETDHRFVVGATLGNNGRLSLAPESGIKLSKALSDGADATDIAFEFVITNKTDNNDSSTYSVLKVNADGSEGLTYVTFENGKATVSLKDGESIYIGGMTAGDVFSVSESAVDNYMVESVTLNGEAATNPVDIAIEAGVMADLDYINTERGSGNLTVAKLVVPPNSNYVIPSDMAFDITVTLTLDNAPLAGKTYQTANGSVTTDADGKISFSLTHNEQFEIFGLPAGTVATVTETDIADGFSVKYTVGTDETNEATVVSDHTVAVIVHNTYTPDPVSPDISISGNKTLYGDAYNGSFEFTVQRGTYSGGGWTWATIGTSAAVTYEDDNGLKTFNFGKILANEVYSEIGTYVYRVTEAKGDDPYIIYDGNLHSFSVNVTDTDFDGKLEIGSVTTTRSVVHITSREGGYDIVTDFVNTHENLRTASAAVEIQKSVLNPSASPIGENLAGFEFVLTNNDAPTDVYTLKTNSRGFLRFPLNYTADDLGNEETKTFTYTLKENQAGHENSSTYWAYDNREITVTVVLSLNSDNTISATVTDSATNANNTDSEIVVPFTNSYNPAKGELNIDFVNKTLNGRELNDGEFMFSLVSSADNDASFVLRDADGGRIAQILGENLADGTVKFVQPIYFDKVGTYHFDISEMGENKNGVTIDNTVYHVVVTVTDINGVLTADYSVVNVADDEITFVNTYTPAPTELRLDGKKTMVGKELVNGEFSFIIIETDIDGNPIANGFTDIAENALGTESTSVANFVFDSISFNAAGTYYYEVSEIIPAEPTANGISYDDRVYKVTVTVNDDGDGNLYATYTVNGSADTEIAFTNSYKAKPTTATIPGNKLLKGRVWNNDVFSFTLYESDENRNIGEPIKTVSNGTDGRFEFSDIPFTEAGTYYYIVKEDNAGLVINGITYDAKTYYVRIEITDDFRGNLFASVSYATDDEEEVAGIEFTNLYDADDASLIIEGEKVLENREINDGEFQFILQATDEGFEPLDGADPIPTVNDGNEFAFGTLIFTEAGEYYFVVSEVKGDDERVSYDETKRYIVVTVVDDITVGKLNATYVVKAAPDATEALEKLEFVNIYTPKPENITVDIDVQKTVENIGAEEMTPDGFEFVLQSVENPDEKYIKLSGADGKAKFKLEFDEDDIGKTFTYKLTETDTGISNVTYDNSEYIIAIAVSLNEDNELVTEITVDEAPVTAVACEFVNEYDYTVPPPPKAGDSSNLFLWFALLFVSGGGIITVTLSEKKRKAF